MASFFLPLLSFLTSLRFWLFLLAGAKDKPPWTVNSFYYESFGKVWFWIAKWLGKNPQRISGRRMWRGRGLPSYWIRPRSIRWVNKLRSISYKTPSNIREITDSIFRENPLSPAKINRILPSKSSIHMCTPGLVELFSEFTLVQLK